MNINVILTIMLLSLSLVLNAVTLDEQKPDNISNEKWSRLKTAVQQDKLMPTPEGFGGGKEAYLGTNIVIDGNRALVGSLEASPGEMINQCQNDNSGFVSVLEYNGSDWQKKAVLLPSDRASLGCFGYSMSLSNNRAIIGDIGSSFFATNAGAAYLFEFNGSSWNEVYKFKSTEPDFYDLYGYSVSIDGDRVAIGSLKQDDTVNALTDVGAVYIYDFLAGNWTETKKITPSDSHNEQFFGYSVSLNGNSVLIGSPENNSNNTFGSAYLFDLVGSNWTEMQKINASDKSNLDYFGKAVKLGNDRAIIGALGSESIYIFNKNGLTWSEFQKITAFDSTGNDFFGKSLDMSGDRIIVGAYKNNNKGSVYIYDFNGFNWIINAKLVASDGVVDDNYAYSVALSGNNILVGAPKDDDVGESSGSIYSYIYSGSTWKNSQKYITQESSYKDKFGSSISVSNNRAIIGSPNDESTGSAYIYDFDGTSWIQSQKIFASDAGLDDFFGHSVNILGDVAVVGAIGNDNNSSDAGAVYIYKYNGSIWQEAQKIMTPMANTSYYFGYNLFLTDISLFIKEDAGVYVFQNNGNEWTYSETLNVPLGTFNETGLGNSISVDGNKALIGDIYDNEKGDYAGAVHFFEYNGLNWIEKQKILGSEIGAGSLFGASVNLIGNKAVLLAPSNACINNSGFLSGCVYMFEFDGMTWNETHKLIPSSQLIDISKFNDKLVVTNDSIYVASPGGGNPLSKGRILKFNFDGANWNQGETIKLSNNHFDEYFGDSIKFSNGKLFVSAHGDDTNGTDSGAVYIFDIENFIFTNGFE